MGELVFKTSEECQVELVASTMEAGERGADWLPVKAARASFGQDDKTGNDVKADRKLLHYLAEHKHVSVFEHNYAIFLVECPVFVARQIMRHQSLKFNEVSRRYTSEDIAFWIPDKWRKQSEKNKQCSTEQEVDVTPILTMEKESGCISTYEECCRTAFTTYDVLLNLGVAREQARSVLPQSLLTRFYVTGNLRSWWSFLTARCAEDTQKETRIVAERIKGKLMELWPESCNALFED